jgi:hypothetical protein
MRRIVHLLAKREGKKIGSYITGLIEAQVAEHADEILEQDAAERRAKLEEISILSRYLDELLQQ